MELEIYWTRFAQDELHRIFEYYLESAGEQVARRLVNGIYNSTLQLASQPEIGQREKMLANRQIEFRYLLHREHYKIIYRIDKAAAQVEINDVFDVRQNPAKITRST